MNVTPAVAAYDRRPANEHKQSRSGNYVGLRARFALDRQTKRDAFKLRHLSYHSNGYIDARADGEFSDPYDFVPSNRTVVIYDDTRPVASVRVCFMDPSSSNPTARDLPVAHVFPDEFPGLLKPGERAVEINRLVCHPDQGHNQGLVFILFRMVGFMIQHHNPDFVASCVRSNHVGFYKKLRFEPIAGPREYTGLKFMTNFLICRRANYEMVSRTIPILSIAPAAQDHYDSLLCGESVSVFDNN